MTSPLSPEAVEAPPKLSPAEEADAEHLLAGLAPRADQYAGLTPLEAAAAAVNGHISMCTRPSRLECVDCSDELHMIRAYIAAVQPVIEADARADERLALGAAGRLLPEGCERTSEFAIRWWQSDGNPVSTWGTDSLERVRELIAENPPAAAANVTVQHREHWTSQYVPVDPAALESTDTRPEGE